MEVQVISMSEVINTKSFAVFEEIFVTSFNNLFLLNLVFQFFLIFFSSLLQHT